MRNPLQADARHRAIRRVLIGLLAANVFVVLLKVAVGVATGSLAVFGDAIHASVDALNNVLGLAVMRVASKAPDDDHPYGHEKFESLGALLVVVFLSVSVFELLKGSIGRLVGGAVPLPAAPVDVALLALTLVVNIWVSWYETRAGRRLNSELLLADAAHTRVDVFITAAVIAGLYLSSSGFPWADPVLAIIVAVLIGRIGLEIIRRAMPTLVDEAALHRDDIRGVAEQVEGVESAYAIRSRTAAAVRFAELTIAVSGTVNVTVAHEIADAVEQEIRARLDIQEIVVHVEPC